MLNKTARDIKWRQDLSSITVELEIKRTTIKKITLVAGRRFIRVTCPDKNFAKVINLAGEICIEGKVPIVDYDNDVFERSNFSGSPYR